MFEYHGFPMVRREAFRRLKETLSEPHRATLAARFTGSDTTLLKTDFPQIDRMLGGGFPRGVITSLEGTPSSGRMAIAVRLLAKGTERGLAAVIDDGSLFPPSLASAGVRLERLLIVTAEEPLRVGRALDIVLRSGAFSVVLMPAVTLKAAVWTRLASLAHHTNAVLLVLGVQVSNELGYFASVRIGFHIERVIWTHEAPLFSRLLGYDIRATVQKHKRAISGTSALIRSLFNQDALPATLRQREIHDVAVPYRSVL
ncbi:MAG: hypothetical protein GIW98_05165 [Candidatus Eremiobacteraeota bacterium]|nr:hypothetical protein [Candidatus Eremiobacteraeota bacterium]